MKMRELFTASLYRFKELKNARFIGFGKALVYLIFLSFILAIPITGHVLSLFNDLKADGQEIAEKIPDFTIEEGKLAPTGDSEGFIYQTDSIIFTFDPAGKRSPDDITGDLLGNFISVGLLPDEIVIALPTSGITTSLLGSNHLEFPYAQGLTQLNGNHLREYLSEKTIPWWLILLIVLVSLYPAFINLVTTILITCIGASILSGMRRLQVGFLENLKILIFSATLPVILAALVSFLSLSFDTSLFIILASLFIYNQAAKGLPKRESQV